VLYIRKMKAIVGIPPDLKQRLMTNLGVTGEMLEAALRDSQDPSGQTILFLTSLANINKH
jgi:hypothetical protein